jgi:hypothetical protein
MLGPGISRPRWPLAEVACAARPELSRAGPARRSPVSAQMELGQHRGGCSAAGGGSSAVVGGWPEAERVVGDI